MASSRPLPRVGMSARAGDEDDALVVVAVEGPRVVVAGVDGDERAFVLHPLTGHWVREGDPYWGLRLALG